MDSNEHQEQEQLTSRRLLTPAQVAAAFNVCPRTVTRWANQGRIAYVRTPAGHRRYPAAAVQAFLNGDRP
jgi:excisionase family DNA binding protein